MYEHADDGRGQGLSRRQLLQRGAVVAGAAAVWSTPVVRSLGMRPAAAATEPVADFCPKNQGSITRLVLRYTGKGCDNKVGALASDEGCSGQNGDLPNPAFIAIQVGSNGNNAITWTGTASAFDTLIDTGIPRSPQPSTWMFVYPDKAAFDRRATPLVTQRFHTSCSKELFLGEQYGPVEIFDGDWEPN